MTVILKNNAFGFLQSAVSNSDASIVLQSGNGANFPTLGAGDYFYMTISPTSGTSEITKCTARSGDTLTIVRAQEGTSAQSFAAGSRVELRVTAQSVLDAISDRVALKDQASEISFTPTGGIAATNVQTALAEVDSEKIAFTRLDDSDGSSLVGFQPAGLGSVSRTAQNKMREIVSVKDFGARGDGTGVTPASEGVDISNEAWNTWDNTPFKDNAPWSPWYANMAGTFQPPRVKPFANDDTWDFIGGNLALWYAGANGKCTYFPAGVYKMNASSSTSKGPFQGLYIMKGQEQTVYGEGPYKSIIEWKENAAFFTANNFGVIGFYKLFELYRTGGPPSNIFDLAFSGPNSYDVLAKNITLIDCQNINGVTFRDLWLTTGWHGISATTNSGDSHASRITSEYLFGATVYTDAGSDITINFVNFWASAAVPGQQGVHALGRACVTNSRFVEFYGTSINAVSGMISDNLFSCAATGGHVINVTDDCVISGNQFTGQSNAAFINTHKNASITGNVFRQTANHPCINLGNGTTATNITVTGNTFIKTDAASEVQNFAIVAIVSGVNYTGAATQSCIISGNTFQGRSFKALGGASMTNNAFSDVTGVIQSSGDVQGRLTTSGTNANASFTITVNGLLGQGEGSPRDIQRIYIVNVDVSGTALEIGGVAIYRNNYLGNAVLLGTLGTTVTGGTITFGASGTTPTVAITNTTGNTATYRVTALPMI
jgi:hypothetical protein